MRPIFRRKSSFYQGMHASCSPYTLPGINSDNCMENRICFSKKKKILSLSPAATSPSFLPPPGPLRGGARIYGRLVFVTFFEFSLESFSKTLTTFHFSSFISYERNRAIILPCHWHSEYKKKILWFTASPRPTPVSTRGFYTALINLLHLTRLLKQKQKKNSAPRKTTESRSGPALPVVGEIRSRDTNPTLDFNDAKSDAPPGSFIKRWKNKNAWQTQCYGRRK